MDRKAAQTLIENTFNYPFDEDRFRYFAINLLTNLDREKDSPYISGKYIKDFFREHVHKYRRIGTYIAPDGDKLDVLVVHLVKPWALERARTMLRNFTAWYLKDQDEKDAALVAYHTDDLDDWRFSFVRMEYRQEITEKGTIKVKEKFTPARRYSYLVGKNEPNHTAQEQMIPVLEDDQENPTLADIEAAFSVDAVTKQFYKDYRALFEKLTNELNKILERDNKIKKEFEDKSIDTANFSKKLMGQIVFLYFLQKKGWLGVSKDKQGNFKRWGTGPKNFMKRLFNREFSDYKNFFNDILEPLFYNALNNGDRRSDYYEKLDCKIPFLDGGLFEPMNDYDWVETEIRIDNDIFIEILKTFDRYNFTVREDEPLDKEVAVDPEMLGKVFENLLPENLRKGKGAYYTPRSIVHYMCQESLINYLATECESIIVKKDLENLIREGEAVAEVETAIEEDTYSYKQQIPETVRRNALLIDEKLAKIKICDPAIGSGAFPVGMMNEIVKTRLKLDTFLKLDKTIYDFKRHCIQESLYGVDIDPGAIEIAKLRLWLSLVVDEEDYAGIQPLPNLDFKIMQGNSLIEDFHGISLDIEKKHGQLELGSDVKKLDQLIKELHQKQEEFFNAIHPKEKQQSRRDVEDAIFNIFHHQVQNKKKFSVKEAEEIENELVELTYSNKPLNFFPWKLYFADVFREKGGFDVVIANPPYGSELTKELKERYRANYNFVRFKIDSYVLFIILVFYLLRKGGNCIYIIPNTLLNNFFLDELRKKLMKEYNINQLINFKESVFEAVVHSLIIQFSNCNPRFDHSVRVGFSLDDEFFEMKQTYFLDTPNNSFLLANRAERNLLKKICRETIPLKKVIDLRQAIKSGNDEKFISEKPFSKNYKPILRGKDINRFAVNNPGLFLDYGSHLACPRDPKIFEQPHILIRETGSKIIATIDYDRFYIMSSLYCGILINDNYHLEYILALLNSKLLNYLMYKINFENTGGAFTKAKIYHYDQLPIKTLERINMKAFVELVKSIFKTKESDPESETSKLEADIDRMVYDLYGLTDEEIATMEDNIT